MKNILLIAILLLTSFAAKADDYYDIPAGWEKVVEFDSNINNIRFASRDKLMFLESPRMYSKNGGLTFEPFNYLGNSSIRHFFFIEDKLYLSNNVILYKINLFNNQLDTVKSSNSNNLGGYFELTYTNPDNSKIALSYFNGIGVVFSLDNGKTWNSANSNTFNKNKGKNQCVYHTGSDNYYSLMFDCFNPNRWIYLNNYASDWGVCLNYFITDDNGLSFRAIDSPRFNINLSYNEPYVAEKGWTDKYFGFDNSNSAISINYTRIPKQGNVVRYLNNGFKFIDISDSQKDRSFNMDSIMASYLKVDSVNEVSVAIDNDYFLTKDNKILFMSYDNLQSKSKDTIFQKMFLFDYKTMKLEQLIDRKIPLIKDANFNSYSILHFDYNGGYVYYDLTAPQKPNELQKKIIIRRKIQDATSIETDTEKLESICLQDGKIVFYKEYLNPTIEIIDMVGKSLDYKILSTTPLIIEPNPNTTKGAYFLKIKDNQNEKNFKFIFE